MNLVHFPVTLTGVTWSHDDSAYTDTMRDWLFSSGSLTRRLQAYALPFTVTVLSEKLTALSERDQRLLETHSDTATIREVFLCVDGVPWVYAQSVLPTTALNTGFAALVNIGTKPLGELLFTAEDVKRGQLMATCFDAHSELHAMLADCSLPTLLPLVGRRSLFSRQECLISVTEIFLPSCPIYSSN